MRTLIGNLHHQKNIFLLHGVTTGRTLVLCGGEGRRVFTNGFENNYCIVKIAL